MPNSVDVEAFRSNFASLPRLAYLNSGSYGLLAHRVRDAFERYMATRDAVGADWGGWIGALEDVRAKMARLLEVDGSEVAITASASSGLNSLTSALDFSGQRNTIVLSNFDFPTSAQIWHAQERAGARVVHVRERTEGLITSAEFEHLIDERTAIVVLSQVCYRHGGRISDADIKAIAELAHSNGALVVLDSYQIIGTTPVRPRELGVDICVGGMLKYLLGTAGIGFLYVRSGLIEQLAPRATGWFAQEDIDAMDIFNHVPSSTARRFEAGTPPVPSCLAAAAGLELILDTGIEAIGAQIESVTRHVLDRMKAEGIPFINPDDDKRRGPLVSIPSVDDQALVAQLARHDVITSCRDGKLRAGFHAYNDSRDVDRFMQALHANRALLDLSPEPAESTY